MAIEGKLTIVQELNAPIKVNRWLYLFDLFFIIGYLSVCLFFSQFVHGSLTVPYVIFSAAVSILLTLRSPYNPQKRIFQTILFVVKKDRAVYRPIFMEKEEVYDLMEESVPHFLISPTTP